MHYQSARRPPPFSTPVLFAVPAVGWTALVAIDVVLLALDRVVQPGLHSVALGAVVAASVAAVVLWRDERIQAHMSTEIETVYRMLSQRMDLLDATVPIKPAHAAAGRAPVKRQPPVAGASGSDQIDPSTMRLLRRIDDEMTRSDDEQ